MLHAKRQTETLAQVTNEQLIAVGILAAQVMVDVQHVQPLPRDGGTATTVRDVEPR